MIDARAARPCPRALPVLFFLLVPVIPAPALARGGAPQGARVVRAMAQRSPAWRQNRIQQDAHGHPPRFFRRLRDLPPEEQDRILQNDAQFHHLPPARQEQIIRTLRRWNSLTPQQKQVLRQREQVLQRLSPHQRQQLRRLLPYYRSLNPQQRRQVTRAFLRIRNMPPQQRRRFLSSPRFRQRFTPAQQRVLRGWNNLLPQ